MQTDCPFCELKDPVIAQTELAVAVLSDPRKVPGHVLVLPRRHIEQPWQLTEAELREVFELIFKIEQRLLGVLGEGVDIRQNYRPFKKQDALKKNHVLFHIVPRSKDDYVYTVSEKFEKELFADLDPLERSEVTKLLRGV